MAKKNRCKNAMMAAMELIQEECKGEKGVFKTIGDGMLIFVPEEFMKDFEATTGLKFGTPIKDSEVRERAIQRCMEGTWAEHWAEAVAPGASPEVKNIIKRKICEGLIY